jgi:hypothetical protein
LFSHLEDKNQFYLTGGTALAEFYLGHRLSFDLDFFSVIDGLVLPISYQILRKGQEHNLNISVIRRFSTNEHSSLKVDLVLDSPFRFEAPVLSIDGILINDYQDLRIDKLLAYYGRAEPRDAIDWYFILQDEPAERLLQQAQQKDPGFDLYWFAFALNRCADFPDELDHWPVKMLVPFEPRKLKADFQNLAIQIMDNLRS